jgi:hypothetical protein
MTATDFGHRHPSGSVDPALAQVTCSTSAPPDVSTPRAHSLLTAATEADIGALALSCLTQINLADLDSHDRVTYLRLLHAHTAWLEALQCAAVMAVAGPLDGWAAQEVHEELADMPAQSTSACGLAEELVWDVRESAVETEVALATGVSRRTAGRRITTARFLHAHPGALAEARAGRWGYGHLRVVENELFDHTHAVASAVLDEVLTHVPTQHASRSTAESVADSNTIHIIETPARLAQRIRKALARHDADASARIRAKRGARDVDSWNLPDGQARLALTADHITVADAMHNLTALARARQQLLREVAATDVPTLDQLRADILLERLRSPAHPDSELSPTRDIHAGISANRPRHAAILIDLPTALGMADNPGYIPGYGWTPPTIARELAASCESWSRWLIDDSSRTLLDISATKYRPSAALRRFLQARALTCTNPVCERPAHESHLDHADDFNGANTTAANMHPACGPHHMEKTAGYFDVTFDESGQAIWHSLETGHSYTKAVHPLFESPPTPMAKDAPISAIEAFTHRLLTEAA